MTKQRIGFCCKWLNSREESKDKAVRAAERELNTSSTTVAWLNRQTRGGPARAAILACIYPGKWLTLVPTAAIRVV